MPNPTPPSHSEARDRAVREKADAALEDWRRTCTLARATDPDPVDFRAGYRAGYNAIPAASPKEPTPDLNDERVTLEQHGRVIEALADLSAENEKLKRLLSDASAILAMYVAGVESDKHARAELNDGRGYHASSSAGGRALIEEIDAALEPPNPTEENPCNT